ncbi:THAP domain-containing protein 6-like [Anoplophora glabripennis]|uniref:THAP domain-containing protein 6-like n=1 Tax=Anoplophora glabripennis TaxID=217634 RepID=UPI0008751704|nr:THAP domain-containing protein 6-like [Anoplophora glabripennis]
MRCSVFGCISDNQGKTFNKDIMFFRFPNDETILKIWIEACGRKDIFNTKNARMCSRHFKTTDYARNLREELLNYKNKNHRMISKTAVPSQYLPNIPESNSDSKNSVEGLQNNLGNNEDFRIKTECEDVEELKAKIAELEKYKEAMEKLFTPDEIKKLLASSGGCSTAH